MIVIRMYQNGSGVKVRLQQHLTCCEQGDCGSPDEESTERAYPARKSPPREYVGEVARALGRVWRHHSNVTLMEALCYAEPLPLDWGVNLGEAGTIRKGRGVRRGHQP